MALRDDDLFGDYDYRGAAKLRAVQGQKKDDARNRLRQRDNEKKASLRTSPGPPVEHRANSVFQETPEEGPGGQQRLFTPKNEPEAFETKWAKRARTERIPTPPRGWSDIRKTSTAPRRGVSQESVHATLGEQGVTTRGAEQRLRKHWEGAKARNEGGMPRGQDFYAHEQADRFEQDAKHFGVPFHVALAVNAVMSPKTALSTPSGLQTNREAAHLIMQHVTSGKPGLPDTGGRGLRANIHKGAEIMRQHLEKGTHPLDAVDENGKHLLSGPKVEAYYSNYLHPGRTTTDIQHSRVLFGPKVRSELSPEETARKDEAVAKYGKNSPEVGRMIPKTPAEELLGRPGVHEWAAHVTSKVAQQVGVHPSELQSVIWHEHKTQRGGRSAVQDEVKPLFAARKETKPGSQQRPMISKSQFSVAKPPSTP